MVKGDKIKSLFQEIIRLNLIDQESYFNKSGTNSLEHQKMKNTLIQKQKINDDLKKDQKVKCIKNGRVILKTVA